MIDSEKTKALELAEAELECFWNAVQKLETAKRNGTDVSEYIDDIEVIAMHTASANLKRKCEKAIHSCQTFRTASERK